MLFGTETFEFEILKWINSFFQSDFMDFLMTKISWIGNNGAVWIVVALVMLALPKYRRCGAVMAAGLILGLVFGNIILKNLIARPRPCWIFEGIEMVITVPKDYSFPSGHTLSSFVSAFVILGRDRQLGIIAFCVAAVMAFSRLYLFVHFPTDILGGIMLAAAIYFLALKRFLKTNNKKML